MIPVQASVEDSFSYMVGTFPYFRNKANFQLLRRSRCVFSLFGWLDMVRVESCWCVCRCNTSRSFENLPFVQALENIRLSCSFRIPWYSISIAIDTVLAHASD